MHRSSVGPRCIWEPGWSCKWSCEGSASSCHFPISHRMREVSLQLYTFRKWRGGSHCQWWTAGSEWETAGSSLWKSIRTTGDSGSIQCLLRCSLRGPKLIESTKGETVAGSALSSGKGSLEQRWRGFWTNWSFLGRWGLTSFDFFLSLLENYSTHWRKSNSESFHEFWLFAPGSFQVLLLFWCRQSRSCWRHRYCLPRFLSPEWAGTKSMTAFQSE